jgi:antitoxin component of MazEF toxin-antitoxin module
MGTTPHGKEQIRKITKNGSGSYSVTLPISNIRQLRWQDGQQVRIVQKGKSLVITDWQGK